MPDDMTPEQTAEQFAEAVSVRVAGMTHQRLGAYDKAMSCFSIAREIFSHLGHIAQVGWTAHNEGIVLELLGRPQDAIARFNEAERAMRSTDEDKGWPLMYRRRGDVRRRQGHPEEAIIEYDQGLAAYRASNDVNGIINTLSSRAEAAFNRDDFTGAKADLDEAAYLLAAHPRHPNECDALLLARRARCATALGDTATAHALATEARTLIAELSLDQDRSNADIVINLHRLNDLPG